MVAIRVQDTGTGIASEHLQLIFERFRQIDSSTTRAHGGLGLAIVRHLAEAHGGTLAVASEGLGSGAAFTVTLPLRAVIADAEREKGEGASAESPIPTAASALGRLSGAAVLVVDDDEDSLDLRRASSSRTPVPRSGR